MAFFDDIHHIRLASEDSAASQKAALAVLTALAADVAALKESAAAIDASLKKLAEELAGPPVVGIEVQPGVPTEH